jgi:ParB-like chromosome segregation protein Spo0J
MNTTERFEKVNIDRLVPYARNARTHSKEQILQLRASLREFGFVNPVIVDKDLNVIAGMGASWLPRRKVSPRFPAFLRNT